MATLGSRFRRYTGRRCNSGQDVFERHTENTHIWRKLHSRRARVKQSSGDDWANSGRGRSKSIVHYGRSPHLQSRTLRDRSRISLRRGLKSGEQRCGANRITDADTTKRHVTLTRPRRPLDLRRPRRRRRSLPTAPAKATTATSSAAQPHRQKSAANSAKHSPSTAIRTARATTASTSAPPLF